MEFKIENTEVFSLKRAAVASGNPMRIRIENIYELNEKTLKRAKALGNTNAGEGHDQFLTGITVMFDIYAPLYMWKEVQRYHFLEFVSSQSTMHRLTQFDLKSQCVEETDKVILERYQWLLDDYNKDETKDNKKWRKLIASLPSGFILGGTMVTNYRQLKTIYNQRKNHKLVEWRKFCEWCETLPHFKEFCLTKKEESLEGLLEQRNKINEKIRLLRGEK